VKDSDSTHVPHGDTAGPIPAANSQRFVTLSEIYERAREQLAPDLWEVLDGGAGDEMSLRDNIAALARWSFRPRYLSGVTESDPRTTFLGLDLAFPVVTAPIGGDGLFHVRGQCAIAEATAAAGIVPIVSEASPFALETVARSSRGPTYARHARSVSGTHAPAPCTAP
jgi:4-hydroxymandelate oxidase